MKKFTLFLLLAALCLPQTVSAKVIEDDLGEFKFGEVVSHEYEDMKFQGFIIDNQEYGVVELLPTLAGTAKNGEKIYKMGKIYCIGFGSVTIQAVKSNGDVYNISLFVRSDHYVGIGWHGGKSVSAEAADSLFIYRPSARATPLPAFFICKTAQMENKKFSRTWAEIPMEDYNYESSNSNFAFVSRNWSNADSLIINGVGTATITMNKPAGSITTKEGWKFDYDALKHSFNVKAKSNMAIDLSNYPNKQLSLIINEYEGIYDGIMTHISILPDGYMNGTSAEEFGKELTVRLTKESPEGVVELSTDQDNNGKLYGFSARDYGTVQVEITMPETDEYYAGKDTLTINVEPIDKEMAYDERVLGFDEPYSYVTELTLREGDTVKLPDLHEPDTWRLFRPHRLTISTNGYVGMLIGDGIMDSICAYGAGEDTVTFTYNRAAEGPFTYSKLPVHIVPFLEPITTLNLMTNPGENNNVVLNTYYNGEAQRVEIDCPNTDAAIEDAMYDNACGTDAWREALPNTMSFNLPQGKVTLNILCWSKLGYELRAKVRNQEVKAIPSQTDGLQLHSFTFELKNPSVVVFYLVEVSNGSPAPARKAKAEDEEPASIIKEINIEHEDLPTAIETVQPAATISGSTKIFRDGQMLIIRDGKTYTVQGVEVR